MKALRIFAVAMIATLGLGAVASAQSHHPVKRHHYVKKVHHRVVRHHHHN